MKTIGIDNGLTGAIAILDDKDVKVFDMPVIRVKNKGHYNTGEIYSIFQKEKPDIVFIEYAQGMPGQGSVSTFTIGKNYGLLLGILTAFRIPHEIIHPKKWQKEFSISKNTKDQSCQIAGRLYPDIELATKRGRMLDGRADALLIATYGKRKVAQSEKI